MMFPMLLILTLYLTITECGVNNNSLKLLHFFFRHGERSPRATYPNDPYINYTWPGGLGQLSNKGKVEMYELGTILRESYKHFIQEYYHPDEVYMLSSYADRCHMSAQLLLAGLFPPKNEQIWNDELLWQPIPVHSLPRALDNIVAMKRKCNTFDRALIEAYKSDKITKINENNARLYQYLTEHTGDQVNNISTVEILHNTLEIEELNNLTLPLWTKAVYPEKLRPLAAQNLALYTDNTFMKRMQGGPFVKELVTHMINKTNNNLKPDRKLFLYSGHDISIVNILRTLGFDDELIKPGFGASIAFELYSDDEVKLLYRDDVHAKPEELEIKGCSKPCLLNNFAKTLQPVIPDNWEKECLGI